MLQQHGAGLELAGALVLRVPPHECAKWVQLTCAAFPLPSALQHIKRVRSASTSNGDKVLDVLVDVLSTAPICSTSSGSVAMPEHGANAAAASVHSHTLDTNACNFLSRDEMGALLSDQVRLTCPCSAGFPWVLLHCINRRFPSLSDLC
jgi:hypothetical protein